MDVRETEAYSWLGRACWLSGKAPGFWTLVGLVTLCKDVLKYGCYGLGTLHEYSCWEEVRAGGLVDFQILQEFLNTSGFYSDVGHDWYR